MSHKNRNRSFGRHAVVAAISAGSVFQVSSCNIDDGGVISAFANPAAFADLGNQLFEASPLGRLLGNIQGSVDIQIGNDQ